MPLSKRSSILTILFGSAVLVSAATLLHERQNERQNQSQLVTPLEDTVTVNPLKSETPSAKADNFKFHPKANTTYTYAFDRSILIQTGQGDAKKAMPEITYDGEFDLGVTAVDKESGFEAYITQRFSKKTLQSLAGASIPQPSKLRFKVNTATETIEILAPLNPSENEKQQTAILKDLLACWLFPFRYDTTGAYSAKLTPLAPENNLPRIQKTKIAYLKSATPTPEILTSNHVLQWNTDLRIPNQVRGEETSQFNGDQFKLFTQSKYLVQLVKTKPGVELLAAQDSHPESLSIAPEKAGQSENPLGRIYKSSKTWTSLRDQLTRIQDLNSHDQLGLFGDLTALVKSNSKTPGELFNLLQSQDAIKLGSQSPLFKSVIGALLTAGTPEAQSTAIQIYQDPNCPTSGKGAILSALTTTQAPINPETRSFLNGIMLNDPNPDLAAGAGFALGSSLQVNGQESSQLSIQQAVQSIQNSWAAVSATKNVAQELALLDAMGNSGNSSFLSTIEEVINTANTANTANTSGARTSDNPADLALKAKAVFALRFMNDPNSPQILINSLGDNAPGVRLAAASAMGFAKWNSKFQTPLQNCARSDSSSQVRNACQKTLEQVSTSESQP